VSREKIDPPEDLRELVEERFGLAANSRSEMYNTALFYAVTAFDAEHGGPLRPDADAQEDNDDAE